MKFESLRLERVRDYDVNSRVFKETIKGRLMTADEHGEVTLNLSESHVKKIMAIVASSLVDAAEHAAAGLLESCEALAALPPSSLKAEEGK